jgi:hypothetical protein
MEKGKKFIIPALALATVLGGGFWAVSNASAWGNGQGTMVQRIAEKFNLNKDEVQKVFDENREERQQGMRSNFEERLSEAVSKGELTEAQRNLILAKKEEMEKEREANREAHKNLSVEERKKKMEERRAEIEKWAEDNGIDVKYLMGGMGKGGGCDGGCQGQGMGFGKGNRLGNNN